MQSEVWRLDPPLALTEREKWCVLERERERVNEEWGRKREKWSWECYFSVWFFIKLWSLGQISQPLGLVSEGANANKIKV
jgi:hypothetical protein